MNTLISVSRDEAALALAQGKEVWYHFDDENECWMRAISWVDWTAPVSYARKWLSRAIECERQYYESGRTSKVNYKIVVSI